MDCCQNLITDRGGVILTDKEEFCEQVHHTAVEMIRKNSRIVPTDQFTEAADTDYENNLTTKLTLRRAVEQLKQPYRTVVVLFYYENLSVSKIAQITGSGAVAVKQQLSRARKMLREALKEDFI